MSDRKGYHGNALVDNIVEFRSPADSTVIGYTLEPKSESVVRVKLAHTTKAHGRSYIDIKAVTPMASMPITLENINTLHKYSPEERSVTWWTIEKYGGNSQVVNNSVVRSAIAKQALEHPVAREVLKEHLAYAHEAVIARQARVEYTIALLQNMDTVDVEATENAFVETNDGDLGIRFVATKENRHGVVSVTTMSKIDMDDGGEPPEEFHFDTIYKEAIKNFNKPAKDALLEYFVAKKSLLQSIIENIKKEKELM